MTLQELIDSLNSANVNAIQTLQKLAEFAQENAPDGTTWVDGDFIIFQLYDGTQVYVPKASALKAKVDNLISTNNIDFLTEHARQAITFAGSLGQMVAHFRDVYSQEGTVSFPAVEADFRDDYETISLTYTLPFADYQVAVESDNPLGGGEVIVYDKAKNGFKIRITGSEACNVKWKILGIRRDS